jgi:hypothetical protein
VNTGNIAKVLELVAYALVVVFGDSDHWRRQRRRWRTCSRRSAGRRSHGVIESRAVIFIPFAPVMSHNLDV